MKFTENIILSWNLKITSASVEQILILEHWQRIFDKRDKNKNASSRYFLTEFLAFHLLPSIWGMSSFLYISRNGNFPLFTGRSGFILSACF